MLGLSFLSPWLLAGLVALPAIWWLLRLTPPAPARVAFPPARLLEGLLSPTTKPHASPWWLTALRMLIAALIIAALAGPVFTRGAPVVLASRPLLIVVENGWTAASGWDERRAVLDALVARAEAAEQSITLVATAQERPQWDIAPLSPAASRQRVSALLPRPHAPDRAGLATALDAALPGAERFEVHWLGDGVAHDGTDALATTLRRLAGTQTPTLVGSPRPPLGLARGEGDGRTLPARVVGTGDAASGGTVVALSADGKTLAEAAFALPVGAPAADVTLDLPTTLRNQVARLELRGERSAGAVALIDASSYWHRVALLSGETRETASPLLSPLYYIDRALRPHAELRRADGLALDEALRAHLAAAPAALMLADIGRLTASAAARVAAFVDAGGVVVRFAGPRLEQGGDDLLPVPLRAGERQLGGALSWSKPQTLGAFEQGSPFFGLAAPADVTISRQMLADPARLAEAEVWARLADGTPLVTAARRGKGMLVLFHVTANSDWSNLPMSGLFVDMLRRVVALAPAQGIALGAEAGETPAPAPAIAPVAATALPAWRTLDGFGVLGAPPATAGSLPAAETAPVVGRTLPPGLYGQPNSARALNIVTAATVLRPLAAAAVGANAASYAQQPPLFLAHWLLVAALALFALDALLMLTVLAGSARVRRAAAALALLLGIAAAQPPARAQDSAADQFAQSAAQNTRLAYVVTGEAALDEVSRAGLAGLSQVLAARTAVEPGDPVGVDLEGDELVFFPLLYWPVDGGGATPSDTALARIDAYMKQGGMVIFDTRDEREAGASGMVRSPALQRLLGKLDIPRLAPVSDGHVLTKSFYILQSFPGRYDSAALWAEAGADGEAGEDRRALVADGVSSILITGNDLAAAWALDARGAPLNAVVPGGEAQREMAFRVGINIVMYALTGNYKADQVHVPALLERLGQ